MKSPRNKVMSAVSVLVLMTGFLLPSWDAEAANTPDTKPIVPAEGDIVREVQDSGPYKGCTISHPEKNPYKRVITGSCAGHVFKRPELSGLGEEMKVCQLQDLGNRVWIADCFIDGQWRPGSTEITDAVVKPPAQYPELVASARARSKVDPVFLGIVLGEQWDRQSVNKCSGDGPRTNTIPFCSYGDKDGLTSHAGVSWTDCVAIDREAFDITWLGIPGGELLTKRSDCRVYVSVLSDGTVGKISMVTSSRFGDIAKIKTDLIKKYGSQYDTKRYISEHDQTMRRLRGDLYPQQFPEETVHLWTLPGLWVSYREQVYAYFGIETGVLEIHTGAPASVTVEKSKPRF